MRQKTDKYQMLKFSIEEKLDALPHIKRDDALKTLPAILDVSPMTFYNYRTIKKSDKQDIPSTKLAMLARYFNCKTEDLINVSVDVSHFKNFNTAPKPPKEMGLTR